MARYIRKIDKREKIVASTSELQDIISLYIERDTRDLSDKFLANELGMNVRTFKRRKNKLVNEGLLEVRKIGAMTYEVAIGELAIAKRNKLFEDIDMRKIAYKVFGKEKYKVEESVSFIPKLTPEDAAIWEDVMRRYKMPTTEEITSIL